MQSGRARQGRVGTEVGSSALRVATATFSVAVLHFRQCSGSAHYIFK